MGVLAGRGPGSRSSGKDGKRREIDGGDGNGRGALMDEPKDTAPGSVEGTDGNSKSAAAPPWPTSPSNSSILGNTLENSEMLRLCTCGDDEADEVGDGGPNEDGDTNEWTDESVRLLLSAGATKMC